MLPCAVSHSLSNFSGSPEFPWGFLRCPAKWTKRQKQAVCDGPAILQGLLAISRLVISHLMDFRNSTSRRLLLIGVRNKHQRTRMCLLHYSPGCPSRTRKPGPYCLRGLVIDQVKALVACLLP